ncbi:MAG TPA: flagellar basal body rod protein [Bacillus sp. (in: firmicutes)]|uniref:lmo0954 family membrane protein n=1 Tax=Bacillus litorisediminis TaxID=2922713 RepID=UPI001FAD2600|nr:flagellar basal body rod protein [Bacillus litorisediminis]HWO74556.1 flagellar basal body rod protein [Bacillus sp. (in: firmicutes)]
MKKFLLLLIGGTAILVLLGTLGPMVGLAISAVILYYSAKEFIKAESTGKKILWAIIGLIALSATLSNVPALAGVVAIVVLYLVYKKWNKEKEVITEKNDDPFVNFEREWSELKKHY